MLPQLQKLMTKKVILTLRTVCNIGSIYVGLYFSGRNILMLPMVEWYINSLNFFFLEISTLKVEIKDDKKAETIFYIGEIFF